MKLAFAVAALAACGADRADGIDDTDEAVAHVGTTAAIPADGACAQIVATRLADFHVTTYQGTLAGAAFSLPTGETRVTATAFPLPCNAPPAAAPWVADDQLVTFVRGPNTLTLHFHENDSVTIDPDFDDPSAPEAEPRAGSVVRTGRNGEGASGPNLSLDGWELKRIALPPAAPDETIVMSFEGKDGLTQTPRDVAALPDGSVVAQQFDRGEPLRLFDAAGNFVQRFTVVYPAGTIVWDGTDGIEAIDATHLVRTGFLNNGIDCDAAGVCTNGGIEVLELAGGQAIVRQQLRLPAPFSDQYPVGVAPVGDRFAVSVLPNSGGGSQIILLDATGAVVAGPTLLAGDVEGLFATADGRLACVDYHGHVTMLDATTLAPRTGETAFYTTGAGVSLPQRLAWDTATNDFLVLADGPRLLHADPAFGPTSDVAIDFTRYAQLSGVAYRGDTNQILLADRLPPVDAATHTRIPAVDTYAANGTLAGSVTLQGISLPARTLSIAFVGGRNQILSNHRRPNGVVDQSQDARVYTNNADGSAAGSFSLAPFGFLRIANVAYLAATDEILVQAVDEFGVTRLVVTAPDGTPRRSYRVDATGAPTGIGPIASGPAAGDVGAVFSEPSHYAQLQLP